MVFQCAIHSVDSSLRSGASSLGSTTTSCGDTACASSTRSELLQTSSQSHCSLRLTRASPHTSQQRSRSHESDNCVAFGRRRGRRSKSSCCTCSIGGRENATGIGTAWSKLRDRVHSNSRESPLNKIRPTALHNAPHLNNTPYCLPFNKFFLHCTHQLNFIQAKQGNGLVFITVYSCYKTRISLVFLLHFICGSSLA